MGYLQDVCIARRLTTGRWMVDVWCGGDGWRSRMKHNLASAQNRTWAPSFQGCCIFGYSWRSSSLQCLAIRYSFYSWWRLVRATCKVKPLGRMPVNEMEILRYCWRNIAAIDAIFHRVVRSLSLSFCYSERHWSLSIRSHRVFSCQRSHVYLTSYVELAVKSRCLRCLVHIRFLLGARDEIITLPVVNWLTTTSSVLSSILFVFLALGHLYITYLHRSLLTVLLLEEHFTLFGNHIGRLDTLQLSYCLKLWLQWLKFIEKIIGWRHLVLLRKLRNACQILVKHAEISLGCPTFLDVAKVLDPR